MIKYYEQINSMIVTNLLWKYCQRFLGSDCLMFLIYTSKQRAWKTTPLSTLTVKSHFQVVNEAQREIHYFTIHGIPCHMIRLKQESWDVDDWGCRVPTKFPWHVHHGETVIRAKSGPYCKESAMSLSHSSNVLLSNLGSVSHYCTTISKVP